MPFKGRLNRWEPLFLGDFADQEPGIEVFLGVMCPFRLSARKCRR